MHEILLDERQASVVSQSNASVEVRDPAGALLGLLVPNGARSGQDGTDHWIESLTEWYLETDADQAELQKTN